MSFKIKSVPNLKSCINLSAEFSKNIIFDVVLPISIKKNYLYYGSHLLNLHLL